MALNLPYKPVGGGVPNPKPPVGPPRNDFMNRRDDVGLQAPKPQFDNSAPPPPGIRPLTPGTRNNQPSGQRSPWGAIGNKPNMNPNAAFNRPQPPGSEPGRPKAPPRGSPWGKTTAEITGNIAARRGVSSSSKEYGRITERVAARQAARGVKAAKGGGPVKAAMNSAKNAMSQRVVKPPKKEQGGPKPGRGYLREGYEGKKST